MYYAKPLMAEDVHYVASIMSEISNIIALHSINHSLAEWKCIFDENARDADEENFLICADNDVCAWLKLNGLQNKDTAWISMLVVADNYKHQGVGKFAVEYAFKYLHSKGFNQIGVQTTEDNDAAKSLYMRCGFSIAESKEFRTDDGTNINSYVMLKTLETKKYSLVLPDETHKEAYIQMMDKWEVIEKNIQPELLRRYSKSLGANVSYWKWLQWCEDDRTTGSMLSTGVPCTLYFFVDDTGEILGAIEINQRNTHRGHLHAGIVPWHRGKGLGTKMLESSLEICRNMGMTSVDIAPYKSNKIAVKTIIKNGGVLKDEFFENGKWSQRYTVSL
ncbi:MAG: GNAT family N-acetyltransferase [Clostridia bacterium]|nr:GNAT family N-acetyltransferase [Clostridia bacterium]